MSVQAFHRLKHQDTEQAAQRRPQFGFRPQPSPQLAKQGAASLLDLVDEKRHQHQQGQHRRQMLFPVSIVMFEVVALILQRA